MYTKKHAALSLILLGVITLSTSSCQRRCQGLPATAFLSLVDAQWRLVETSDSGLRGVNKYDFLIFTFSRDFTGDVQRVESNTPDANPIKTFGWKKSPSGSLLIEFADPNAQQNAEGGPSTPRSVGPTEYGITLNSELKLYDVKQGIYYRFIPYEGIVDPDNDCTF